MMGQGRNDMAMMQEVQNSVNWGQQQQQQQQQQQHFDMRPIVTVAMLQCQMCTQRFSTSGKLSDHRTPVLAVNPSHSIEGPYCIACAGKRDGLRSFQIDEARVALCKLWHQQLSMGAAYAALHHHQQQRMAAVTHPVDMGNNNSNPQPLSATVVDITRRMAAKRDAPGQDAPGMIHNGVTTNRRGDDNALAMPPQENEHTTYAGCVNPTPPFDAAAVACHAAPSNNKRSKLGANGGYVKTTWTPEEDAILTEAVTTSTEQPFTRWSDLAHQLPGRVGKQIRDRWLNHLDPRIDRSPFTRDEDVKLYQAYKKHGKRWVEISTKFFDCKRSENHVKNRWYSAAFKKFVRQELGEDPFDTTTNNNSNATTVVGTTPLADNNHKTTKDKSKVEPPPATTTDSSEVVEEKKDD